MECHFRMADLPFFQMDSNVVWRTMPYLAWSARAFSPTRQPILAFHDVMLSYDTPLWHNNCFRNQHAQTYFCPQLIKVGVLTLGQLLEDDSSFQQIAPTWRAVYQIALGGTTDPSDCTPQASQSRQKTPALLGAKPWPSMSFWCDWMQHHMAEFLSTSSPPEVRQPPNLWATLT